MSTEAEKEIAEAAKNLLMFFGDYGAALNLAEKLCKYRYISEDAVNTYKNLLEQQEKSEAQEPLILSFIGNDQ